MSKLEEKEFFNSSYFKNKKILVGSNHQISSLARFYGNNIKLGKNVRIDDDVVLKGKIKIGSNTHIARGCTLSGGQEGIAIGSFTSLSNFIQIFAASDDYFLPYVPAISTLGKKITKKFSKLRINKISIGDCCIIGAMSIILPGGKVASFTTIGAYSVIYKSIEKGVYYSNRDKKDFKRKRNIIEIKKKLSRLKKSIK
jgi:acetyltransferase-like isoleucine patch superfamily enzyme